jgi:Dolichyl-phosphate-mannose-protein mannosyltransferase
MSSAQRQHLFAGILIAVFLAQSFSASLQKSPVYDEPPHIASGLSYLATGVFRANPQHPPLLKEISALFLEAAGIHWPQSDDARALIGGVPAAEGAEWPIGNDIIYSNGPDRVLFWARLPFILFAGLLGLLIYVWGRELVGPAAALGALFLYAFDPTMVAHSFLVTTDVGLAAFSMLFLWTLWRYVQQPVRSRMVMCGLAMGAMLGAKFSAAFMVASGAILLFASVKRNPRETPPSRRRPKVRAVKESRPSALLARLGAFLAMCAIAALVVEALYFFPHDPLLYLKGIERVNADHTAGYQYYFHGDTAMRFYSYFVAAYLLKEPLATLLLVAIGLAALLRARSTPMLTKLFLLLPPAVFVLAMTIFADDMGVRYLIPAMPFAYLIGGMGLAMLLVDGRAWTRYAALALSLWVVIAAAGIYPDHLSYFNETTCLFEKPNEIGWDGGSRCGPLWLDDSNVDWGQGLKQLRDWTNRHADLPPVHLSYTGTFPPEGYGLRYQRFLTHELMVDPAPGWYAVSAGLAGRLPTVGEKFQQGGGAWLRRMRPVEIVGHAFYIYHVR